MSGKIIDVDDVITRSVLLDDGEFIDSVTWELEGSFPESGTKRYRLRIQIGRYS